MTKIKWKGIKKNWAAIIVIICVAFCLFTFYIYFAWFHNNGISKKTTDWGTFGDYISGIIGTIISLFSVFLIYLTYTNQVENSRLQQFETTFFNLLQNQREILKSIKGYIETYSDVSRGEKEGSEYINTISFLINHGFDGAIARYVNYGQVIDNNLLENKEQSYETIDRNYKIIYKDKQAELGDYFRHLYHILKYVDESKIENRKKYTDIIQAQMSDNELYVTFYNGISEYGNKRFLPMLDKYYFFENIRSRGEIFDKHKKFFYPKTPFKYHAEKHTN